MRKYANVSAVAELVVTMRRESRHNLGEVYSLLRIVSIRMY
jgi:hypothetical protein